MENTNNLPAQDSNTLNDSAPGNKTNRALIFIIVILLLIIVGGGGFILAKYLCSPKPVSDISTQQPVINSSINNPSPSPNNSFSNLNTEKVSTTPATVDETANWKTQTYSGFSLKVPSFWFAGGSNNDNFAQLFSFDFNTRGARDTTQQRTSAS